MKFGTQNLFRSVSGFSSTAQENIKISTKMLRLANVHEMVIVSLT